MPYRWRECLPQLREVQRLLSRRLPAGDYSVSVSQMMDTYLAGSGSTVTVDATGDATFAFQYVRSDIPSTAESYTLKLESSSNNFIINLDPLILQKKDLQRQPLLERNVVLKAH